jgi:predicted deacetylase
MDILDEELLALWKSFEKHQVRYIMVGGFATNLHGFSRTTDDCDIWISDSIENRKKLRTALEEVEELNFEMIETMDFAPGWSTINLFSGIALDIMTYLKGFPQQSFEKSFENASIAEIYQLKIRFLHINELIEAKRLAARPKDLIDIQALENIKKQREE